MRISAGTQYLHELVDSLSAALEVPVELTDGHLRTLARAEPDLLAARSRRGAISPRRLGIAPGGPGDLSGPVTVPAVEALGIPGFATIPLYVDQVQVALLWLTDVTGDLTAGQLDHARATAQATVTALAQLGAFEEGHWEQEDGDRVLLTGDLAQMRTVLSERFGDGRLGHDDRFLALGLWVRPANTHYTTVDEITQVLRSSIRRVGNLYPESRVLVAQSGDLALLLVAPYASDNLSTLSEKLSAFGMDLMYRYRVGKDNHTWLVSVSAPQLSTESAAEALWQARQGLALGQRLGWSNRRVSWDAVGHLRGISTLPTQHLRRHFIEPALLDFLENPEVADLRETLESYLLNAGNVQKVAAECYLHRASVYHRLKRIEDMLQVDLSNGHDRLQVHLGVIAWGMGQRSDDADRAIGA